MNIDKEEIMEKIQEEIEVIKGSPVLFVIGVIIASLIMQMFIGLFDMDRVSALNEQIREKNVLIIQKDERINDLLDQIMASQRN